ncbi:PAP2 domain-containing protein [Xylariales sp. PMI_506]|nr:PAP2 domain-containing protein [Xylariales sp. PMI_506]
MAGRGLSASMSPSGSKRGASWVLVASYVSDWLCLVAAGVVGLVLGNITPNKRPFRLQDPDISFPYTEKETVSSSTLVLCNAVAPIVIILFVTLVFVPGSTVPKGTPKSLIWKRKLWELHAGWLGLALSLISAWFITNGMKNLFGKPRPDLLSRCQADLTNITSYIVGGYINLPDSVGQLVSADICKNPDTSLLNDGFRSYPSGHSSSAAAGLIYLSLFLASKFSVTIPFVAPAGYSGAAGSVAFPSRIDGGGGTSTVYKPVSHGSDELAAPHDPNVAQQIAAHSSTVTAARKQAAAPPIYLLILTVLPFFAAIFIASSRWFDFRHHGFDILFGFMMGTITAFFAFRYYHMPISQGAGWAWAPRSPDKAFWAGIGVYSYATDKKNWVRPGDEEEGLIRHNGEGIEMQGVRYRPRSTGQFENVESPTTTSHTDDNTARDGHTKNTEVSTQGDGDRI